MSSWYTGMYLTHSYVPRELCASCVHRVRPAATRILSARAPAGRCCGRAAATCLYRAAAAATGADHAVGAVLRWAYTRRRNETCSHSLLGLLAAPSYTRCWIGVFAAWITGIVYPTTPRAAQVVYAAPPPPYYYGPSYGAGGAFVGGLVAGACSLCVPSARSVGSSRCVCGPPVLCVLTMRFGRRVLRHR